MPTSSAAFFPWPMDRARKIYRHIVDISDEISAAIEIKTAQKILIGFAAAGVLRGNQTRHNL